MAVVKINVEEFMLLSKDHLLIDVRSEGEYNYAHIPSAFSLPLFNNEERKVVGTAYKQQSRQAAIKIGLDYFGKKMRLMVEEVEKLVEERQKKNGNDNEKPFNKNVLVHCWRGGMRSGAVAWLLDLYGFKVYALNGGYKAFRNWVLQQFERDYDFSILGGYTGSAKTYVLHELKNQGALVIDLEQLASHKGSAFGNIGLPEQPTQEMFENMLAVELKKVDNCQSKVNREEKVDNDLMPDDGGENIEEKIKLQSNNYRPTTTNSKLNPSTKTIWIEDESRRIGTVNIPTSLWNAIRQKHVYFLDIDFERRLDHIVHEYGKCEKEKLVNAIIRIQKRLGGLETKTAINLLIENDKKECFRILLKYYDKQYDKALLNRDASAPAVTKIACDGVGIENAQALLQAHEQIQ